MKLRRYIDICIVFNGPPFMSGEEKMKGLVNRDQHGKCEMISFLVQVFSFTSKLLKLNYCEDSCKKL